jgi:hypothetical protein
VAAALTTWQLASARGCTSGSGSGVSGTGRGVHAGRASAAMARRRRYDGERCFFMAVSTGVSFHVVSRREGNVFRDIYTVRVLRRELVGRFFFTGGVLIGYIRKLFLVYTKKFFGIYEKYFWYIP